VKMGATREPRRDQTFRVLRTLALIVLFTGASLYAIDGDALPPRGHPLLYATAMSWLMTMAVMIVSSAFFRAHPGLFPLARWEKDGEIYEPAGIRAFRWVLLHSPLGWVNPNFHVTGRTDCDRLVAETHASEGVHWLTCVVSVMLAIWCLAGEYVVYGAAMLLVRISQVWSTGGYAIFIFQDSRDIQERRRVRVESSRGSG
jgi:hypothetical protein